MTPMKPRHPCKAPGCPGLTHGKYCTVHEGLEKKDKARWDANRGGKVERGYGGSWERARLMFLNTNPLCYDCGRAAELVHHICAIADGGERLDAANMMALCVPCHGKGHGVRGDMIDARSK